MHVREKIIHGRKSILIGIGVCTLASGETGDQGRHTDRVVSKLKDQLADVEAENRPQEDEV